MSERDSEASAAPGPVGSPRSFDPVLGWILLAALVVRLVAFLLVLETPPASDELDYVWRGSERAQGIEPANLGFRPPATELLYAGVFLVTGTSIPAARFVNVILGVLLLVPLYQIGMRVGGRGTARLGTALAAGYPEFIAFSHYLWSETLYLLLVLWGIALVLSHVERASLWRLTLAGVTFALSALTRVVGAAFVPIVAAWLLWRSRDALRTRPLATLAGPACMLLAAVATIAPWSAHLNRPGEPFAAITRTTYLYLYIGNGEPHRGVDPVIHYDVLGDTAAEREARAREIVLPQIWKRMPWWPFEKLASELPDFFTPTSFAVRRLLMPSDAAWPIDRAWAYDFGWDALDARGFRVGAVAVCVLAYVVLVLLGTAGSLLLPASPTRDLLALFVLSQILPTLVTFAISRFRFAAMAAFLLAAAWLIRTGTAAWREAPSWQRTAAAAATAAVAAMIALRWDQLLGNYWG